MKNITKLTVFLSISFLFLSHLDAFFTISLLMDDNLMELNPLMNWVLKKYGWKGFLITKTMGNNLLIILFFSKEPGKLFVVANGLYLILTFWHIIGMILIKGVIE